MIKDMLLDAIEQDFDKAIVVGIRRRSGDRESVSTTSCGLTRTEIIGAMERVKFSYCMIEQKESDKEKKEKT